MRFFVQSEGGGSEKEKEGDVGEGVGDELGCWTFDNVGDLWRVGGGCGKNRWGLGGEKKMVGWLGGWQEDGWMVEKTE